jgi:hypothetical protein
MRGEGAVLEEDRAPGDREAVEREGRERAGRLGRALEQVGDVEHAAGGAHDPHARGGERHVPEMHAAPQEVAEPEVDVEGVELEQRRARLAIGEMEARDVDPPPGHVDVERGHGETAAGLRLDLPRDRPARDAGQGQPERGRRQHEADEQDGGGGDPDPTTGHVLQYASTARLPTRISGRRGRSPR